MSLQGLLIVISAPSGAGKATVISHLIQRGMVVAHPVSVTTRSPRDGERDGHEYFFRSREDFETMRAEGAFVEWAEVHGNLYGTLRSELDRCLAAGADVLLELDVQGMRNLRNLGMDPVAIFLMPPSIEELERRLRERGKDAEETIQVRLQNAREEISAANEYNYSVINDDIDTAVSELHQIIEQERSIRS